MDISSIVLIALAFLSPGKAPERHGPALLVRVGTSEKGRATRFTMTKLGSGLNMKGRMELAGGQVTVEHPIELKIEPSLLELTLDRLTGYPDLRIEVEYRGEGRASEVSEYRGSRFIMRREGTTGKPVFEVR